MMSSMAIFRLWCQLCEIQYHDVAPSSIEDTLQFWKAWNLEFIKKVTLTCTPTVQGLTVIQFASLERVGGFHFMPFTEDARFMTIELLRDHPQLCLPVQ